jgi:hypothetical protein
MERITDLLKLGSTTIALRGIIAVHREPDALPNDPTEVVLEGGVKIRVSQDEGEFARREWERWAAYDRARDGRG